MTEYKGRKICGGIAAGPLFVSGGMPEAEKEQKSREDVTEAQRFEAAYVRVQEELKQASAAARERAGEKAGEIVEARLRLLMDEGWVGEIRREIREENRTAGEAVAQAGEKTAAMFREQENAYIRARSEDIENLTAALARALCGEGERRQPKEPSIIAARELSPEDVLFFDPSRVLGFVTEKGSPISHTAILAGTLNIPFLSDIDISAPEFREGTPCVIDGDSGRLMLDPEEEVYAAYLLKAKEEGRQRRELEKNGEAFLAESPVQLFANIGKAEDAEAALLEGARGIGLFRTEFLYMDRELPPTEEEQLAIYRSVLETMKGLPVIIRTIDIGADKKVACVPLPREENPALGTRGIRISFANPELFRTQTRALLRAGVYGNLKIMYPMITAEEELDDIFAFVQKTAEELEAEKLSYRIPPQGIMIETPAAALVSEALAKKAAFFSVGTNDLTQYTLALDRTGENLLRYYRPHHEAILRLIGMAAENAHRAGIEIGICGELGADPEMLPVFLDMGIDELSMAAPKIKKTAGQIARIQKERVRETAAKAEAGRIGSPVDGVLVAMEDIPDPVFSSGSMGTCMGVEPDSGEVYAPCDGVITAVAATKHAFGLRTEDGEELLIHIGIDTVKLEGQYFDCGLEEGRKVKKGERLMHFDPQGIRGAGYSPMVIVVRMKG